ncbi:hypothetical protein A6P54_13410 [Bacillus sp. MKU004]|nr:hypothetical protein A6P54_13410 [Bacillus sp. MKU004]
MKKKVLIMCSNMDIGGFQKSLISLLTYFDYESYEVDLLLFRPEGIFMDLIPEQVNVISSKIPKEYFMPLKKSFLGLLKKRHFKLMVYRLICSSIGLIDKGMGAILMSKAIPPLEKTYNISIDYNGQYILYYMVDKVKANKKITYFHSDYEMWSYYKNADRKYYKKVDNIVTVSDICVNSLIRFFPSEQFKVKKIENIISEETVNIFPLDKKSFEDNFDGVRILTVGRVCIEKGIDIAIEACSILKSQGLNVRWYVVGPIFDKEHFTSLIKRYDLKEDFIFLGPTNNPYNYMRDADIIAHPSKFEGKAVVIEEAKILKKLIVATSFSTVFNQLKNGEDGIIVEMDKKDLAAGIKSLIENIKLRDTIFHNLNNNNQGNKDEVNKLFSLMEFEENG